MIKRILVTGGAGFLGSHLCDRLVEAGQDVICVDNFFTSQKANVSHLLERPNFELVRHDVTHPLFLEVDEIYNLACPAAPGHYQYNPIKTIKTSVMGAINMLGLAKRVRARILHASTSEVYGDPDVHPQPESYRGNVNPIGPLMSLVHCAGRSIACGGHQGHAPALPGSAEDDERASSPPAGGGRSGAGNGGIAAVHKE